MCASAAIMERDSEVNGDRIVGVNDTKIVRKNGKSTDEKMDETGLCVMSVQTRSLFSKVITEEEPKGEITGELGRSSWSE